MTSIMLLGRLLFAGYFLYSGINHFQNSKGMAGYAKSKGLPSPEMAVLITGVMLVVGGAGLLMNLYVSQSVLLLLAFLIPTTFIMHAFWKGGDAMAKMSEKVAFTKNMALIGALLMML